VVVVGKILFIRLLQLCISEKWINFLSRTENKVSELKLKSLIIFSGKKMKQNYNVNYLSWLPLL